ncbi:hypothetical protein CFB46_11895 [Burkholderia sp. HI2761]|uniref:hypothetical protein n=1 Tax=unclassified Burkholderia TaxID=2613784 RepID=UPI000B7A7F72|nr:MULTISPECIES: hypothetical protein [unclassified Burkholderia]MPV55908.1 hypothetical protein [Burkholderia sp. BE24]OXJ27419.1 hypothetical protein CFB46_11895 [Burkholderia sp. HI2761]
MPNDNMLTAEQIGRAWRASGAVSATPPDWALKFACAIEREALAAHPSHPGPADALLYEHDDGSYAVALTAEDAIFTRGDPAWHRAGPVTVYGSTAVARSASQPEPHASAGVIAAARAVIEADRAQTLTTEHVNALDHAIKIQHGELTLPEPRAEVTDDKECAGESHE